MNEMWMRELAERHGLADQAGPLMERISAWLLNQGAGLNDVFAKAGLSKKLSSWLGDGGRESFTVADVRALFGSAWVSQTATDLGLETGQVEQGTAEGLPFVLADVGHKLPVAAAAAGHTNEVTTAIGTSKGPVEWLAWVVLFLAVSAGVGFGMRGCGGLAPYEGLSHHEGPGHGEHGDEHQEPHSPSGVLPGGTSEPSHGEAEPGHGDEPVSSGPAATPAKIADMSIAGTPPVDAMVLENVANLVGPSEMAYKADGFHIHGSSEPNPNRENIEREVRTLLKGHEVMFHWDLSAGEKTGGSHSEPHTGEADSHGHTPSAPSGH